MSILFETVEFMQHVLTHVRYDEDTVDRLNHKISVVLLSILAVVVTASQFIQDRIRCWPPAEFPDHWVQYTDAICWVSNTYYIPMSETDIISSTRKEVVYYQWIPLVLFLQAFICYLPHAHWTAMCRSIGHDIDSIAKLLRSLDHINPESRDSDNKAVVMHIERVLSFAINKSEGEQQSSLIKVKQQLSVLSSYCRTRQGSHLVVTYLVSKFMYVLVPILQLILLPYFLGTDYMFYGVDVIREFAATGDYKETRHFPRVTLCDFEIRTMARNIPHTVQCTLPLNIYNEKVFIIVWFWLALLAIVNMISFVYWLWIVFLTNRIQFVKTYLCASRKYEKGEEHHHRVLRDFCRKHLQQDGVFLLRMISKNTNHVTTCEVVDMLWNSYRRQWYTNEYARSVA